MVEQLVSEPQSLNPLTTHYAKVGLRSLFSTLDGSHNFHRVDMQTCTGLYLSHDPAAWLNNQETEDGLPARTYSLI